MPIRKIIQEVTKVWSKPYLKPFAIGWGVVLVVGAAIPVSGA
jgi:hypothetical protein